MSVLHGSMCFSRRAGMRVIFALVVLLGGAAMAVALQLPITFEPNRGQTDPSVCYCGHAGRLSVFLQANQVVAALALPPAEGTTGKTQAGLVFGLSYDGATSAGGANSLLGATLLPQVTNYYYPGVSLANVPNYSQVSQAGLYPGVNVTYTGTQQAVEFAFTVAPHCATGCICMRFHGAEQICLANGCLDLQFSNGSVVPIPPPTAYQVSGANGATVPVSCCYQCSYAPSTAGVTGTSADTAVTFTLGNYDQTKPLIIDPALDFSTYLGGIGNNEGSGISADANGNAYLTGNTDSADFPIVMGYQSSLQGAYNAFVTRLNTSNSQIVYSTYFGGSGSDRGARIVTRNGNAYVLGTTSSTDFPLLHPIQHSYGGGSNDAFVAEFNPTGGLLFSSYYGGSGDDEAYGLAVDVQGIVYITGITNSADFPTTCYAYQRKLAGTPPNYNAFVAKLDINTATRLFSGYFGGSGNDFGYGIAVDACGFVTIGGDTSSTNLPVTPFAYQRKYRGNGDVFVAKFTPDGSTLLYATYLGGAASDHLADLAVDAEGNAYLTGNTSSPGLATRFAYQTTLKGEINAYVAELDTLGQTLCFFSYLGGSVIDNSNGVAVDALGCVYLCGETQSEDFPTVNPLPGEAQLQGPPDAFVAKFDPTGHTLLFSTYLGGTGSDIGTDIALPPSDGCPQWSPSVLLPDIYVIGNTDSTDFPIVNPTQTYSDCLSTDVFVSRIKQF